MEGYSLIVYLLSFKCKVLIVTALLGKILLSFKLCSVCAVSISFDFSHQSVPSDVLPLYPDVALGVAYAGRMNVGTPFSPEL